MKTKKRKPLPPKHANPPTRSLYVQMEEELWLRMSKIVCRKKGLTWRYYIEALVRDYLDGEK